MEKIRVLVVDDHTIVRDGICALLNLSEDIDLVGEATNGKEALETLKTIVPDVILMDIAMPIMGGLETTRRIRKDYPKIKIIILTQYDDKEYVYPAIKAGANGFISKCAESSELVSAVRYVYRGDSYLSPSIAKYFVEDYQSGIPLPFANDPYEQLTDREKEVLKLVVEGYSTQQIADILYLSPKTVEGHRTSLMGKLNIRDRVELTKYAIRKGIIIA
jgi:DNA-binding NarL/FixJ family response regulator